MKITHEKSNGCGIQLRLTITGEYLHLAFERQDCVLEGKQMWMPMNDACLTIIDIAKFCEVFRGMAESINEGKGLLIRGEYSTRVLKLSHRVEPTCGYCLSLDAKYQGSDDVIKSEIFFNNTEALAIAVALEAAIAKIAWN